MFGSDTGGYYTTGVRGVIQGDTIPLVGSNTGGYYTTRGVLVLRSNTGGYYTTGVRGVIQGDTIPLVFGE